MKNLMLVPILMTAATAFADIAAITPTSRMSEAWWAERHAAKLDEIKVAATNGGAKVVFLGDSITHFWETRQKSHWNATFGKFSPFKSLNLGFSGDRTQHLIWRIENGELDGYSAKVFVLMIGTNNPEPPMDVVCGVKAVMNAVFRKQPKARMVLCAIFPRGWDKTDPRRIRNERVNDEIRTFCDGRKIVWCDFGEQFLAPDGRLSSEVMPDALHPSDDGYAIWAAAVAPYVSAFLSNSGTVYNLGGRLPSRWSRAVTTEPEELLPKSRAASASMRWVEPPFGTFWWLNRVEQARSAIARANGKVDLVMLGDSITHFWQQRHPESWATFTANRTVANFGCAGDKVQHTLWMAENGALDGFRAKAVSILIGTNNNTWETSNPTNVAAGIRKLVAKTREKQPEAKIILTAIFPRGNSATSRHFEAARRNDATNELLRKFAAGEKNVVWLDFNRRWLGADGFVTKDLMADYIHPTAKGYDIWIEELDRLLGPARDVK